MAEQFYTILTSIGKAKIANASALGNKVNFTHFALGDGGGKYYNPTESQTELKNEVWRGQIGQITVDEKNPNWIVIETIIPADQGGFMIREAGIFDEEDNLLAIGKYPETYKPVVADGSAKDLYIRMILEVVNTSVVNLKVDPGVILATKKDIEVLEQKMDSKIENIDVPIKSVNGQIGDVKLTAKDVGAETPSAAQDKANAALNSAKSYTDQEVLNLAGEGNTATVKQLNEKLKSHEAEVATQDESGHIKLSEIPVQSVNEKKGEVTIDVPDISGLNMAALALGCRASAAENSSVALGEDASAAKNNSVALGASSKTEGLVSVAIGYGAEALETFSAAIGPGAESLNSLEGVLGRVGTVSKWIVPGDFTVEGTKNFEIPHPKPEKQATHRIRHGAVESPTAGDTLYRYKVTATKDNDLVTIDLPDYFIYLNKDVQIFVTPQGHFGNGYGVLNEVTEQLEIRCQLSGEYNVLAIGTRNDNHQSVQDWNIKGVEREVGESWAGETYAFDVDEIMEIEEIKEVV